MNGKKGLAWLVIAVMLVTALPLTVFSDRGSRAQTPEITVQPSETEEPSAPEEETAFINDSPRHSDPAITDKLKTHDQPAAEGSGDPAENEADEGNETDAHTHPDGETGSDVSSPVHESEQSSEDGSNADEGKETADIPGTPAGKTEPDSETETEEPLPSARTEGDPETAPAAEGDGLPESQNGPENLPAENGQDDPANAPAEESSEADETVRARPDENTDGDQTAPLLTDSVHVAVDAEPVLDAEDMQIIYDFISFQMPDEALTDEEYDYLITEYLNKVITDSKKIGVIRPILFKALKVNGEKLTGVSGNLYAGLKEQVTKTAAGEVPETVFSFTPDELGLPAYFTYDELGLSASPTPQEIQEALKARLKDEIDLGKVLTALTTDMPYEMYWYDKTSGTTYSYSLGYGNGRVTMPGSLEFDMAVAKSYQPEGATSRTSMNTEKGKAVQNTVANAKAIVEKYADLTDFAKLIAYKNEICSMVDYNYDAANNSASTPYGDPWQLVYVFDNDDGTKVVCEGYSKAFQYLCDLSEFDGDVTCYTVNGKMGNLSEQGEAHMWNIVTIDGVNYLVDVTNSDQGSVGQDGSLFMKGFDSNYSNTDGSYYVFTNQTNTHTVYVYNNNDGIYSTEELTVSGSDYTSDTHDVLNTGHILHLQDKAEPT